MRRARYSIQLEQIVPLEWEVLKVYVRHDVKDIDVCQVHRGMKYVRREGRQKRLCVFVISQNGIAELVNAYF